MTEKKVNIGLLVGFALWVVAICLILFVAPPEEVPDLSQFFGRFHPLVVHMPIGILLIGFVLETLGRFTKYKTLKANVGFILFFGGLFALVSIFSGFLLSWSGGYEEDTLWRHQWSGMGVALLTFVIIYLRRAKRFAFLAYPTFCLMMIFLVIAGHLGGSLTHGEDYLTAYLPFNNSEEIAIESTPTNIVYTDYISPIFNSKCINCHGAKKQKGKLRLDAEKYILTGGESGKLWESTHTDSSLLVYHITLPLADEKHMPPKGKTALTDREISLLKWWIREGADFTLPLDSVEQTKENLALFSKESATSTNSDEPSISPASEVVLDELSHLQVLAVPLSQSNNFLQVSFVNTVPDSLASALQVLEKVASHVKWLDISGHPIPKAFRFDKFIALEKLIASHGELKRESFSSLATLSDLKVLNLFGATVPQNGIEVLEKMKQLKKIYVTNATLDSVSVASYMQRKKKKVEGLYPLFITKVDTGKVVASN